jgi:hypothetical protein
LPDGLVDKRFAGSNGTEVETEGANRSATDSGEGELGGWDVTE